MSPISQTYYHEFLRCTICSHDFDCENPSYRPITFPMCGHTMCGQCIDILLNQSKCPQDQIAFGTMNSTLDQLPTNYPLLNILFDSTKVFFFLLAKEFSRKKCALLFSYLMITKNVMVNVYRT